MKSGSVSTPNSHPRWAPSSIVVNFFYEPYLAVSLYAKNLTALALGEEHTILRVNREPFYTDNMLPLSGPVGTYFTEMRLHPGELAAQMRRMCCNGGSAVTR
jgi:hypothetical protein